MLDSINSTIFYLISANKLTSINVIKIAIFFSKYLIYLLPVISCLFCFWKFSKNLLYQRLFIFKTFIVVLIGFLISTVLKLIFYKDRPFVHANNQRFLYHLETSSFPSNHASVSFSFLFSYFFWFKNVFCFLFFLLTLLIIWSKVFLGIHWPLDIIGSFFISFFSYFIVHKFFKFFIFRFFIQIIKIQKYFFLFLNKKLNFKKYL